MTEKMEENKIRNMPYVADIYKYWQDEYELSEWTRGRHSKTTRAEVAACFACGKQGRLDRAHILAKCDGGTDTVENLHLLCRCCHVHQEVICSTPAGRQKWLAAIAQGTPFYAAAAQYAIKSAEIMGDEFAKIMENLSNHDGA
jgi:hypothetical protein